MPSTAAAHAIKVIVLQEFPRPEHVAGGDLARIYLFAEVLKVCPCVGHALFDGRFHFR